MAGLHVLGVADLSLERAWEALRPANDALRRGLLLIGLAHRVKLKQAVTAGQPVHWLDVEIDEADPTVRFRRKMEQRFGGLDFEGRGTA